MFPTKIHGTHGEAAHSRQLRAGGAAFLQAAQPGSAEAGHVRRGRDVRRICGCGSKPFWDPILVGR